LLEDTGQRTHHDSDRPPRAASDVGLPAPIQEQQQRQQRTTRQKHFQYEIRTYLLPKPPQYVQPVHDDLHCSLLLALKSARIQRAFIS